ncbi:MAG: sigma factor-like helix-turn-helix DNA-binding protein [Egibacteraceae bacterium]
MTEVLRLERRYWDTVAQAPRSHVWVPCVTGAVDLALLIDGLPPTMRQAFTLTQLLGLPYDQAAKVAGCRVGTIRSRVFRSRARLVAQLQAVEEPSDR